MPQISTPNLDPRYYAQPTALSATIGAAAITAFPQPASQAALLAIIGAQASGSFTFTAQPTANATITINGVVVTFVAAGSGGFSLTGTALGGTVLNAAGVPLPFQAVGPAGLQCQIGATQFATNLNLLGLLRSWPDEALQSQNYRLNGNVLRVVAASTGTGGNAVAISTSAGANATLTGAGTTASGTAGSTTLTGGTAPTSGYAVLSEPQPHTLEIQAAWGVYRGYLSGTPTTNSAQSAGTMTLFLSNGTTLTKADAVTFASGSTLAGTQEFSRIPFTAITPTAAAGSGPLVVPAWTGLYAYGGTTQVIDVTAAPAGSY